MGVTRLTVEIDTECTKSVPSSIKTRVFGSVCPVTGESVLLLQLHHENKEHSKQCRENVTERFESCMYSKSH